MTHSTEDLSNRKLTWFADGWVCTRTFVITGLVGDQLPRRGMVHPDCAGLLVRKRRVDRNRSRRGLYFVNVHYAKRT